MSIISPNAFGNSLSFGADSRQILTKFRNENGDSHTSLTYNLGVPCNEDSDCPMGNLCMDSQCYYKCNNTSVNDCPFWHTCRSDIQLVHNPYLPRVRVFLPPFTVNCLVKIVNALLLCNTKVWK